MGWESETACVPSPGHWGQPVLVPLLVVNNQVNSTTYSVDTSKSSKCLLKVSKTMWPYGNDEVHQIFRNMHVFLLTDTNKLLQKSAQSVSSGNQHWLPMRCPDIEESVTKEKSGWDWTLFVKQGTAICLNWADADSPCWFPFLRSHIWRPGEKKFLLSVKSTLKVCHLILFLHKELILKQKGKKNVALGYDPWASAMLTHVPGT